MSEWLPVSGIRANNAEVLHQFYCADGGGGGGGGGEREKLWV